jgi:hypothetical protein
MGFATIENVIYFHRYSVEIAESRAFYACIMHMFTSSVIAYQMMYSKYKLKKSSWLGFIPGFILAIFIHGTYNALIGHNETYEIGIAFTIVLLVLWGRLMNNALNQSPFFDETVARKTFVAGVLLLIGWGVIFIYVAISLLIMEGSAKATQFIQEGVFFGLLSGIGLFAALAFPKLRRGEWRSIFRRFGR